MKTLEKKPLKSKRQNLENDNPREVDRNPRPAAKSHILYTNKLIKRVNELEMELKIEQERRLRECEK